MGDAQYLHSTPFRFEPSAFGEVVRRLREEVKDVSVRCSYDTTKDTFCLRCPTEVGPKATDKLKEVLLKFIAEELAVAEREERVATIKNFLEFDLVDGDNHGAALTEPTASAAPALSARTISPSKVLHFINLESSPGSYIRLFPVGLLPADLIERILPFSDTPRRVMETGVTARVVKWDEKRYIFNGRTGSPTPATDRPGAALINSATFCTLSDLRILPQPENGSRIRMWEFKDGDTPTINQFLAGMGQTQELTDPYTEPERPEDAANFLAGPSFPPPPQGRIRVPKAEEGEEPDADSDRSEDEPPAFPARPKPSPLMEDSLAATTLMNDDDITPTATDAFAHLNNRKLAVSSALTVKPEASSYAAVTAPSTSPYPNENSSSNPTSHRSSSHDGSSTHIEGIPAYDRKYAAVDRQGLSGIAANQAQWEHDNPVPKKPATNKSGIGRRQAYNPSDISRVGTPNSVLSVSTNGGQNMQQLRSLAPTSTSVPPSPSLSLPGGPQSEDRKWARNIIRPQARGNKLIDDSGGPPTPPARRPPGLDDKFDGDQNIRATQSIQANMQPPSRNASGSHLNDETPLIDFSDEPIRRDSIVERLQPTDSECYQKKYTMGQKAKPPKNGSSRKPKASKAVVELPKPDPVPQPAKSKKSASKPTSQITSFLAPQTSSHIQPTAQPSPAKSTASEEPKKSITAVEELLRAVVPPGAIHKMTVKASFGIILTRHPNIKDFFPKGGISKSKVEAKFQEGAQSLETAFFPKLTTSTSDALYLLAIVPQATVKTTIGYEIVAKDAEGSLHTIKFDQADKRAFKAYCSDDTLGTMFVHYPIRVWDAKLAINGTKTDTTMTSLAFDFVSSITTVDKAPEFMAMIPTSFNVERVYAKRMFSKTVSANIELKITEVQDLLLESINEKHHNIKASVAAPEDMIRTQRYWWECELFCLVAGDASAAQFQGVINKMIGKMDGVGYGNQGPFVKEEQIEEEPAIVDPSFW